MISFAEQKSGTLLFNSKRYYPDLKTVCDLLNSIRQLEREIKKEKEELNRLNP